MTKEERARMIADCNNGLTIKDDDYLITIRDLKATMVGFVDLARTIVSEETILQIMAKVDEAELEADQVDVGRAILEQATAKRRRE